MIRALLALSVTFVFGFSASAAIEPPLKRLASCERGGVLYEVFADPSGGDPKYPHVMMQKSASGERTMTAVRLETDAAGAITGVHVPKYWPMPSLPGTACRVSKANPAPTPTAYVMRDYVRFNMTAYALLTGDLDSVTDPIDKLICDGDAFTLNLDVLCQLGGSGPAGCETIQILNRYVDVSIPTSCP